MHVYRSKLTLKFTGYCRQTSYTDSTVIHTLVPAVAWELQSQFAPGYMHFNIIFWRCLWEDMNISQWKIGDRTFFSLEVHDRLLLLLDLKYFLLVFCRKSFYWPLASSWLIRRKVGNSGHPKITLPIYYIPFQVKLQGECWAPPPPVFGPCRVKSIRLTNQMTYLEGGTVVGMGITANQWIEENVWQQSFLISNKVEMTYRC